VRAGRRRGPAREAAAAMRDMPPCKYADKSINQLPETQYMLVKSAG
jgi:hypothetical protein